MNRTLVLLNQLFYGKGDKTSLAKLRQCFVPPNSTSMSLGVQPQPFFRALSHIGKTVWSDSGFAERFLFTTIKPYRWVSHNCLGQLHMDSNSHIINMS